MIFSTKQLSDSEKEICLKTISSKAIFSLVGDAIISRESISIVRMGDGERKILEADENQPFTAFSQTHEGWNKRLGIEGMSVKTLKQKIIEAGDTCTYFAPSISGISLPAYNLYNYFQPRPYYLDNFYVNDWTGAMIKMLLEASDGVFIMHRDYKKIITNFENNYPFLNKVRLSGFAKNSWEDNEEAVDTAIKAKAQLILYSGGPGGKIIGPQIANASNKIVLDIGNTLVPWSEIRLK